MVRKKKSKYEKPTQKKKPNLPPYQKSWKDLVKSVAEGDEVVLTRRLWGENGWRLVDVEGIVLEKCTNCIILNHGVGMPWYVIHNWEIR